jgi:transcriptional antiterminator NusG
MAEEKKDQPVAEDPEVTAEETAAEAPEEAAEDDAEEAVEETAAETPEEGEEEIPEEKKAEPEPEEDPDVKWYALHTYSGYENKVRESLIERMSARGYADDLKEVLIPSEEVVELRKGKRKVSERKIYPGYIFIKLRLSDETWHVVKDTPKITGFVGSKSEPSPVSDEDVQAIVDQMTEDSTKPKPKVMFRTGEPVRVVDGPFNNFIGVVEEVNPDKAKLKVMVSIFGRSTPVELDFLQVEKM